MADETISLRVRIQDGGAGVYDVELRDDDDKPLATRQLGMLADDAKINEFLASLAMSHTRDLRPAVERQDRDWHEIATTLGSQIFGALFDDATLEGLKTLRDQADTRKRPLRLRFETSTAPGRAIVPWEALYCDDRFLLLEPRLSLVRTPPGEVRAPPPIDGPLRVLVVAASPGDQVPVSAEAEYTTIQNALGLLIQDGRVHLERLDPPTWPALQREIARQGDEPWHVLHFVGHGVVRDSSGVLVLCSPDDPNRSDEIEARTIGQLLQGSEHLRLVVLNGCRTANDPDRVPLHGVAAQLAHHHVPAIIAMQAPITDDAAVQFATELYSELAKASTLDEAVRAGRTVLIGSLEWLTPVVFLRGSGQLFELSRPPSFRPVDELPATMPKPVVARPWLTDRVAAWLRHEPGADAEHLLITGDLGAGTSVSVLLLAAGISDGSAEQSTRAQEVKSGWNAVLSCSARAVGGASDAYTFITRMSEQLARTTPAFVLAASGLIERVTSAANFDDDFQRRLAEPLRTMDVADQEVRLLLEGLEEADHPVSGPSVPDLVERLARLRREVRILVCCSNDDALLEPFVDIVPTPARIDLSDPEQRSAVDDDIRRLVVEIGGAEVTVAQVEEVVEKAAGSFLYATHVARQLATPGGAEQGLPADLEAAYRDVIDRALAQAAGEAGADATWSTELEPLLGCLTVAQGPVPIVALARWLQWDTTRLAAALGRYSRLVRHTRGQCAIRHPALQRLLVGNAPSFADRTVDPITARRRIVETTLALGVQFDPSAVRGDDYSLSYLPFHIDQLIDDDPRADSSLDAVSALILTDQCVGALDRATDDPVIIGRPYRDLGSVLARRRSPDDVARVLRFAAASSHVAVRSVVLDVLLSLIEQSTTSSAAAAAEDLVVGLATGDDAALAALAIHATCGIGDASKQARVFSRIVRDLDRADDKWADARRIVAAYGLYVNSRSRAKTLDDVLKEFVEEVKPHRVTRLRGQLQFITEVTVTNYINHVDEPDIVERTNAPLHQLLVKQLHVDGNVGRAVEKIIAPLTAHLLSTRVLNLLNSDKFLGHPIPNAEMARRVLEALDPSVPLAPCRDELAALLDGEVDALRVLAAHAIGVHQVANPDAAGPVVDDLWAHGGRLARRWLLLSHTVLLRDTPTSWGERLRSMTETLWSDADENDVDQLLQGVPLLGVPLGLAEAKAAATTADLGAAMRGYEELMRSASCNEHARHHAITGLGITGLHHSGVVFGVLHRMQKLGDDTETIASVLGIMAGLHPLDVRAWAEQHDLWGRVTPKIDLVTTRKALNIVGHFNHAVYACVHYEFMRKEICRTVYEYFLDAKSSRAWSDRYAKQGMKKLREADFEPKRWTM